MLSIRHKIVVQFDTLFEWQEILEATREASEQQKEQLNQYMGQIASQSKICNEWKSYNQKLMKDMEKR
jgi:hypothetical protein